MNRREFLQGSVPATVGLTVGLPSPGKAPASADWELANKHLKINLSRNTNGGLAGFTDLVSQRNFVSVPLPLYRLSMVQKGGEPVRLSSKDAASLTVDRTVVGQAEVLDLSFGPHGSHDITVKCRISLEPDSPLSHWRISVKNDTGYAIRSLHYPLIQSSFASAGSVSEDVFVWGAGGGLIRTMHAGASPSTYTIDSRPAQYPGECALQMQAYYNHLAGLYMATYDAGINVKHFGFSRGEGGVDLSIEHNYDERPGLSFELPYDTVLGVFHGDWYAAADLYKEWATKQFWCARTVLEREDLPTWIKKSRPVLEFECRADYQRVHGWATFPSSDYPNGRFWPAKKVIPLSRRYSSIFNSPVVVWYNGWEKFGNPSGPVDTMPPLEGAESLKAAMDQISKDGNIPYMAVWGNHWHCKRSGAGYNGWERFQREGAPLAVRDDRGEFKKAGGVEFTYVNICQGSEQTQQLFLDHFLDLINLGSVALEFDIGAWPSPCYSDQHGHTPGFGPWMGKRTTEFFRKVRQMAKKRNPEAAFTVEGVAEPWIQDFDVMLDRPYFPGMVPLFTYVYHEFMPLLGGDGRYGISHPEEQSMLHAANFAYGHMKFVTIGDNGYDFDVNPDYPIFTLLKNLCEADRGYARDYVMFGRMLKPTHLKCETLRVDGYVPLIKPLQDMADPPLVEMPRVIHGVWASPAGKIGYVLVNWGGEAQDAALSLVRNSGTVEIVSTSGMTPVTAEEVQTGNIHVTVPSRSVVLVEQAWS
jgi:hypothetical protein